LCSGRSLIEVARFLKRIETRKFKCTEFVQLLIDLQQATRRGEEDELLKSERTDSTIVEFNRNVLLWGSPTVIRAFLAFRSQGGTTNPFVLGQMDKLLGAIRKDLGLSNWRLQKGDLVKLFLKDPTELDKMLRDETKALPK
jgi:hypothetical protein